MSELIGQILANRYRVATFFTRGGMAEVYRVWDSHRMTFKKRLIIINQWST